VADAACRYRYRPETQQLDTRGREAMERHTDDTAYGNHITGRRRSDTGQILDIASETRLDEIALAALVDPPKGVRKAVKL
jgi:hypothetical protein